MTVVIVDIVLVAFLLAADLLTKHFISARLLSTGHPIVVIKDVLAFRYSENTGAAFGIFNNARVLLSVMVGIVVLGLIGFMVYHIIKGKHKEKGALLLHIALSMIVAGGLGNLVDRVAFGYVRDFIEYTIVYTVFKKNFAICNFADVCLTIGVILLIVYLIVFYAIGDKKKEAAKEPLAESVDPNVDPLQTDSEKKSSEVADDSETSESHKDNE